MIREVDGDVFAPRHGHLPRLAGKKTHGHRAMIADMFMADPKVGAELEKDIYDAVRQKRFGDILSREIYSPIKYMSITK